MARTGDLAAGNWAYFRNNGGKDSSYRRVALAAALPGCRATLAHVSAELRSAYWLVLGLGQPVQPGREVPATLPKQRERGRDADAPDHGGIDEDSERQADADHLQVDRGERGEDREDRDHDHGGASDHARTGR